MILNPYSVTIFYGMFAYIYSVLKSVELNLNLNIHMSAHSFDIIMALYSISKTYSYTIANAAI